MPVSQHDHFALSVTDLDRSAAWYQDILGLEPKHVDVWWSETARFFGCGEAMVALFLRKPSDAFDSEGIPPSNHQAFRVSEADYLAFKRDLPGQGVSFREMEHVISQSIYFQDPDGYWIEITTYENTAGKPLRRDR